MEVSKLRDVIRVLEYITAAWFTFEVLVRFLVTVEKLMFIRQVINIIDFLAVLPFYISLIPDVQGQSGKAVFSVLQLARVVHILYMVFKAGKDLHGIRVLIETFKTCFEELSILAALMVMAVVMISSGMYYCENSDMMVEESDFSSISRCGGGVIVLLVLVLDFLNLDCLVLLVLLVLAFLAFLVLVLVLVTVLCY